MRLSAYSAMDALPSGEPIKKRQLLKLAKLASKVVRVDQDGDYWLGASPSATIICIGRDRTLQQTIAAFKALEWL